MSLHILSGLQIRLIVSGAFVAILFLNTLVANFAAASQGAVVDCTVRLTSREVGRFSTEFIDEASGLALSDDGVSFFVINDSGDEPRFFRTRIDGSQVEDFRVRNWKPWDPEEIAFGPCPKGLIGQCIVLADIGDNKVKRKSIELVIVRALDLPVFKSIEKAKRTPVSVNIARKLLLKYPDGPHNAEAYATLNARFGLIVTKEQHRSSREAQPAGVYVVDFETERIEKVATWDVPNWVKDRGLGGLVTSMSIAPIAPGSGILRVLLLTYGDAVELTVKTDLLTAATWPPRPWSINSLAIYKIDRLEQQEAVTFDKNGNSFYYTSESPLGFLGVKTAAIRWVETKQCR